MVACMFVAIAVPVEAQIDVLTNRYDAQRTGANLSESTLTPDTVNANQFGKLYSYPVDGAVYAQPLYVSGVAINGVVRNVLYVATMNDKVYAFDADRASVSPLWMRSFTSPPSVVPVPITDITGPRLNIVGNVGVAGTPVIDRASGTIYLVARTRENGSYLQRLHALDIATGAERTGSPVTIEGSFPGNAPDAVPGPDGPAITFDSKRHNQRAGLALTNGVVLIAWGSHEDAVPYHGWIMGFDATTLARVGTFAVTPDVYGGGVWQAGRAPTIDAAGNAYFATGNGKWDGKRNFGDSLLKFSVSRAGMALVDYFTPANEAQLNIDDDDLSGSGFTLLPGTNLLLGGGKEGVLYLLNAGKLGGKVLSDTQIIQKFNVNGGHVMGGPVFWKSSTVGALVYNWAEEDVLKAYLMSGGKLETVPYAQGQAASPGHPGGSLTISANGAASGTGIVWASMAAFQDGIHGLVAGVLRAYDAETLRELWTSEQSAARDRVGTLMKFVPPVVVNGRVYLPNHDNQVAVYGPLPSDFRVGVSPGGQILRPGGTGTFSVTVDALAGFKGSVDLSATGYPAGTTVVFTPRSIIGAGTATMTVTIAADEAAGSFGATVTGRSGGLSRSAPPVVVNVSPMRAALGVISIDFVGSDTAGMSLNETAGVIATSHWNSASGAIRTAPLPLVDETGAKTTATVTWASNNTWSTPVADVAGNARMMKGYLDTSSANVTTVTVAGLAQRAYDVYVYVDGDNRSYGRSAAYRISGPGVTSSTINVTDPANTNFSSTFVEALDATGNFIKFTIVATGFTVTATPTQPLTGTRRAPVNGIQIVPTSLRPPAVGVNFVGNSPMVMAAAEIGGVVARSNWNNAAGASRSTPMALVDETGAITTAAVSWTANGVWSTPVADQAGNVRLMRGYLDTSSTGMTTVTVHGLVPNTYDVYVYVDGDNRGYARTAAYTITGSGFTATRTLTDTANTNFSGTFKEAADSNGNYVKFTISGSTFSILAKPNPGGTTTLRAPINAIQIVPAGVR
jgi:hypothetical protein